MCHEINVVPKNPKKAIESRKLGIMPDGRTRDQI